MILNMKGFIPWIGNLNDGGGGTILPSQLSDKNAIVIMDKICLFIEPMYIRVA